jgi:hypothetical protein
MNAGTYEPLITLRMGVRRGREGVGWMQLMICAWPFNIQRGKPMVRICLRRATCSFMSRQGIRRKVKLRRGMACFYISWYWFVTLVLLLYHHMHFYFANVPKHRKAQILHSINHPRTQSKQSTHLLAGDGVCASAISLLSDGKFDTLALWQRNPRLLRTNDENVALTGSK